MAPRKSKPVAEAVVEATRAAGRGRRKRPSSGAGRASDVFGGELRRHDVIPLLVLHLIQREPAYGNGLIEEISDITAGTITVNPNTMYPLLRQLESDGKIRGRWEHPDRRTRRFYEITRAGREDYGRMRDDLEPFLESMAETISTIQREIYS